MRPFNVPVGVLVAALLAAAAPLAAQDAGELAAGALGPYTPPACVPGVPFSDITCTTGFDPWIEQFALDGITAGCGGGKYCPSSPVTRDQMAVFIEKAMRGTAGWPPHTQIVWAVRNADGTPNPTASGTALLNAVAAIPTSGNDVPSAANPWLLKIGPGIYDLGSSALQMVPFVDVEGSGTQTTVLTATGSASQNTGTVVVAGGDELRSLTAVNTGGNSYAIPVYCASAAPSLRNVAMFGSNSTASSQAYGFFGQSCTVTIADSSVAAGGAVYTFTGMYFGSSTATVARSSVTLINAAGDGWGIINYAGGITVTDSTVTLGGGEIFGNVVGIANTNGSLTVADTSVSLPPIGDQNKYAIYNNNSSITTLDHVTLSGSATTDVQNQFGSGSVYIGHSTLWDGVNNNAAFTNYIANSQLGSASKPGGGTFHCVGTWDDNFNPVACP